MRLRANVVAVIVVVATITGGWLIAGHSAPGRAALTQALDALPANTQVAGFTDWARLRTTLGHDRDTGDRSAFIGAADARDFSARSVLAMFAGDMADSYGWTVDDVDWEVYGQAAGGSVVVAAMSADLPAHVITSHLRALGYARSGGVWSIDSGALAGSSGLPGVFANIAVDPATGLIYLSDGADQLRHAVAVRQQHRPSLAGVTAARQSAEPLLGALSATVSAQRGACAAASFADSPATVRQQARNTVAPFGALAAYRFGGRAVFAPGPGDRGRPALVFSMTFRSAAQAARQAPVREALTTGRFLGHTGQIDDVLAFRGARVHAATLTLGFDFDATRVALMSGRDPLLFAACDS